MSEKRARKEIVSSLLPVEGEVKNLLEMFEFFLSERELGKPIASLRESVRDLRLIIGRLLSDHFMGLPHDGEGGFCSALASMLADRAAALPLAEDGDRAYADYCIGEIITCFECAHEIKEEHPGDPVQQKMLALDIPILRPFDYGMRGRLSIVKARKKRKFHRM